MVKVKQIMLWHSIFYILKELITESWVQHLINHFFWKVRVGVNTYRACFQQGYHAETSKWHFYLKRYGGFTELTDFAYWSSCIGKGLGSTRPPRLVKKKNYLYVFLSPSPQHRWGERDSTPKDIATYRLNRPRGLRPNSVKN